MLITHKAENDKNAKSILAHIPPNLQKEEVNKKVEKKKAKK